MLQLGMSSMLKQPASHGELRNRLIDEAIERYVEWREECAAVSVAYRNLSTGSRAEHAMAFAINTAALDREESGAKCYASALGRLEVFLSDTSR